MVRCFGSFGSAIFRRFAGGGPSLSDMTAVESMSSGQGEPVSDDSCDRGGDGYALCSIDGSGGGDGPGELSGELGTLERSLLLSSKDMMTVR